MASQAHVAEVEVVGAHRLQLVFDDGIRGVVDFSQWGWRGVFAPLADEDYFEQVTVDSELGTIVWPNGADVAPDTLHRRVVTGDPGLSAVS